MPAKTSHRRTTSHKKTTPKRASRAPKSFLHKMLTAEGWKRLMMGKTRKG